MKTNKRIILFSVCIIFILFNWLIISNKYVLSDRTIVLSSESNKTVELKNGDTLEENFECTANHISSIGIYSSDGGKILDNAKLEFTVLKQNKVLINKVLEIERVPGNGVLKVEFDPFDDTLNQSLILKLTLHTNKGQTLGVLQKDDNLSIVLATTDKTSYMKFYLLFIGVSIIGLIILFYFMILRKTKIYKICFFCIMYFGILYSLLVPLNSVPDEEAHISTAYHFSNCLLGVKDDVNGIYMRNDDTLILKSGDIDNGYMINYYNYFKKPLGNKELVKTKRKALNVGLYKFTYFGSAVGITVGRVLNLNTMMTLYLGRFVNLVIFAFLASISIKKIPVYKEFLFTATFLPVCIQQSMSYSYDGIVIGLSFLVLSYTIKLFYENYLSKKEIVYTTISSVMLFFCKQFGYAPLSLMPLSYIVYRTEWKQLFNKYKRKILSITIVLMLIFITCLGWLIINKSRFNSYSILYVLSHPLEFLDVLRFGIYQNFDYYLFSMISEGLGRIEFNLHPSIGLSFIIIILFQMYYGEKNKERLPIYIKMIFVCLVLISFVGIFYGIYGWSLSVYPDSDIIVGIQGRYFIPYIPIIMIALSNRGYIKTNRRGDVLCFSIVFLNVIAILSLFVLMA